MADITGFNRMRRLKTENKQSFSEFDSTKSEQFTEFEEMPDFDSMSDEELAEFADKYGIDIGKAKTRTSIIKVLKSALEE